MRYPGEPLGQWGEKPLKSPEELSPTRCRWDKGKKACNKQKNPKLEFRSARFRKHRSRNRASPVDAHLSDASSGRVSTSTRPVRSSGPSRAEKTNERKITQRTGRKTRVKRRLLGARRASFSSRYLRRSAFRSEFQPDFQRPRVLKLFHIGSDFRSFAELLGTSKLSPGRPRRMSDKRSGRFGSSNPKSFSLVIIDCSTTLPTW